MSDQTPAAPGKPKTSTVFYLLSVLLIGNFLYRMLVAAQEYPVRTSQMLQIGVDLLMVAGLVGIRKTGPMPLFWIALFAGIGLFAIRLHSDASWWTGHWSYSLSR